MSLALFLHPQFIFIAKQSSIIWTHHSFVYHYLIDIQIVLCSSDDLEALMPSVTVDMCFRISRVCTMGRTTGSQSFWFALLGNWPAYFPEIFMACFSNIPILPKQSLK